MATKLKFSAGVILLLSDRRNNHGPVHEQLEEFHGRLYGGRSSATGYPKAQAVVCMKLMLDTNICIYLIKHQPPSCA